MKKSICNMLCLSAIAMLAHSSFAASIEQVIVRQQWPWSTDIHVEYKIKDVTHPTDIHVQAFNGNEPLDSACLVPAMSGRRHGISKDGIGTIVIDPVKAFGTEEVALANFWVKLTVSDSTEDMDETLYKIFDLTDGTCEDVTRGELLDWKYGAIETDFGRIGEGYNTSLKDVLIWTGVTNDIAYKTTKLVMRKIPAKGVETRIGRLECQSQNEANSAIREVSFTNDYFMSVFELTEGQFLTLITNTVGTTLTVEGSDKMKFNLTPDRYLRPINAPDYVARTYIDSWPNSRSCGKGALPNNAASIIGNLRMHTGLVGFDLPTEAVWEYACRAGTTNDFNSGLNHSDATAYSLLARCNSNSKAGASGANAYNSAAIYALPAAEGGSAIVGTYRPNAWGLYDMHGNLAEMCLDRWSEDVSDQTGPDPWGPSIAEGEKDVYRVFKGGSYYLDGRYGTSSYRSRLSGNEGNNPLIGIRVCLTVF